MARKKKIKEESLEQPKEKQEMITTNKTQPPEPSEPKKLKIMTTNDLELKEYSFPEPPRLPNIPNVEPRETRKVEGRLTDANMEVRLRAVKKQVRPGSLSDRRRRKR